MKLSVNRRQAGYLAGISLVGLAAIYLFSIKSWRSEKGQIYRIGWENNPPFLQADEKGGPTGLAVELVRQAAQRRGIKLQWVWRPQSSEDALRNNLVDLWPMITITAERKRFIHFSDPFLQHDHCLLVRGASVYSQVQDLSRAKIEYLDLPINQQLLHGVLPNATLTTMASAEQAVDDVCSQRADAFFTEEFSGVSVLFHGRTCNGQPLRLIWIPELRTNLAVGSTFRASAAADQIREGIAAIANEGKLPAIMARWGYFSPWNQDTMNALIRANRRDRWLIAALALFAAFFLATIFGLDRMRRQRIRIDKLQAAAALRESEARFQNMADTAPVMIWVVGPDGFATFFNKQWLAFTGRASEEELGNGWAQGVHPDDRERCLSAFHAAFEGRLSYQQEHRLRRADGEFRWLLDTGVPRFTDGGGFAGYVGCSIDITDHKRQQEQLQATQKLESLGVLAGGIAHDFNNMLAAILTTSESALDDLSAESPAREELKNIRAVAIRGAEIVRELMAYSGKEKTEFEPIEISQLVAEMLHLLRVSIAKQATLNVDLAPHLPPVMANPAQIRQVVMNLITNGSEAIGENPGVLTITTTHIKSVSASPGECGENPPEGGQIRLEVSDTGTGMTEEVQAHIFDPFFTTKFAGRGLGLAAVRGIIQNHGGAISVASAPGRGSRFEILLPCTSRAPKTNGASAGLIPRRENAAATILVVEDEDALRKAVSTVLRKKGFSIIEASDGRSAIETFCKNVAHIDAVLLDMTLPGLPGSKVLDEVRRIRPAVRVVVTTAYSLDTVLSKSLVEEVTYLRKPYQIRDLLNVLGGVLPKPMEQTQWQATRGAF
jgi:PAS domain S-box-containing protein